MNTKEEHPQTPDCCRPGHPYAFLLRSKPRGISLQFDVTDADVVLRVLPRGNGGADVAEGARPPLCACAPLSITFMWARESDL